jgi:2-keto-4-pentenoate hydratase/2-oxohepta-3-ene-1,7-dioic acid hydratase in catechol pathway
MFFSVAESIAFISRNFTLEEGDIILTGTPAGVGPLRHGDTVEVEISMIGTLSNPVVDERVKNRT